MSIGTKIFLSLFYKKVGEDKFGNIYYLSKSKDAENKYRRSVWYKGVAEPSKIPPMWHAWLHYVSDTIPESDSYSWQMKNIVNLTGTEYAYRPKGHVLSGGKRDKATGDYESWQP